MIVQGDSHAAIVAVVGGGEIAAVGVQKLQAVQRASMGELADLAAVFFIGGDAQHPKEIARACDHRFVRLARGGHDSHSRGSDEEHGGHCVDNSTQHCLSCALFHSPPQ